MSEDPILAQLQQYGACDVADALLRLGQADGGFLPGLSLLCPDNQAKIIGRVFTVRFEPIPSDPTRKQEKNYQGHYIDHVTPGSVLFSHAPDGLTQATLGGLMALRLKKIGAAGAVIHGNIRDLAELRETGIPIFARGRGISAANAVAYPARINEDIHLELAAGRVISPGDILVADENGVAHITREMEERVVELLPRLIEQDEKVRAALEGGSTAADAFKLRSL